jgi:hypothetical protein
VGTVSCQARNLTILSNSTYSLSGSAAASINFLDTLGTIWKFSGNTATGVAPYTDTTIKPLPAYLGVSNNSIPGSITRSLGFQIPLGANVINADSVFISITVGEKSIIKLTDANISYCSFSNTELNSLPASLGTTALLQVAPFNYNISYAGAKKIYLVNTSSYAKFMEVK